MRRDSDIHNAERRVTQGRYDEAQCLQRIAHITKSPLPNRLLPNLFEGNRVNIIENYNLQSTRSIVFLFICFVKYQIIDQNILLICIFNILEYLSFNGGYRYVDCVRRFIIVF